ncbi:hypothetical protein J1605_003411 [Eschrichtius robustus]|uniref:Uncharacterized protein n=1 Tax=Eschrichtius robustus TaxID=9764 RepID=A0AB34HSG7_ESCRO|nr:hypothetical protein J1605_003411 [Eschrichtius robustus]
MGPTPPGPVQDQHRGPSSPATAQLRLNPSLPSPTPVLPHSSATPPPSQDSFLDPILGPPPPHSPLPSARQVGSRSIHRPPRSLKTPGTRFSSCRLPGCSLRPSSHPTPSRVPPRVHTPQIHMVTYNPQHDGIWRGALGGRDGAPTGQQGGHVPPGFRLLTSSTRIPYLGLTTARAEAGSLLCGRLWVPAPASDH